MAINNAEETSPLRSFYDQLSKSQRIDLPEFDSFQRTLTQDPAQRQQFYNLLQENRLVRDLPDYESFNRTLFSGGASPRAGQRIAVPERSGARQNEDGTHSTHKWGYAQTDEGFIAYPTLFQDGEEWTELPHNKAIEEARRRGEVIPFETEKEAKKFTQGGWKSHTKTDRSAATGPGIFERMTAERRPPLQSARSPETPAGPPILADAITEAEKSDKLAKDVTDTITGARADRDSLMAGFQENRAALDQLSQQHEALDQQYNQQVQAYKYQTREYKNLLEAYNAQKETLDKKDPAEITREQIDEFNELVGRLNTMGEQINAQHEQMEAMRGQLNETAEQVNARITQDHQFVDQLNEHPDTPEQPGQAAQFKRAMEIEGLYQKIGSLNQQLSQISEDLVVPGTTAGVRVRRDSPYAEDRKALQKRRNELKDRVSELVQVDIDLSEKMNRQRWAGWEVGPDQPDPEDRIAELRQERDQISLRLREVSPGDPGMRHPFERDPEVRAELHERLAEINQEYQVLNTAVHGTPGQRIQHAGQMLARGISELPAGFFGSVAVLSKDIDDMLGGIDPKIRDKEAHELASAQVGQRIRDWAEETFPGDERMQEKWFSDFASAVGSFGSYIALGYIARGVGASGGTAAAVSAGGAGMDRAYQQVYEMTQDPALARQAARWGVLPGLVQVANVVRILHRADKILGGKVNQTAMNHLREAGFSGLNEAIVETIGDIGFNIIADNFTDEDIEIFENWMRTASVSGSAGALSGFMNNLALTLISKGRMRAPTPATPKPSRTEQFGRELGEAAAETYEDITQIARDLVPLRREQQPPPETPPTQEPSPPAPQPPDSPDAPDAPQPDAPEGPTGEPEADQEAKRTDRARQKLDDAQYISSFGETYSDALEALTMRYERLNEAINKRQAEDTSDREVKQYTQQELESQPEWAEIQRINKLVERINTVYAPAYGIDGRTSEGVVEAQAFLDRVTQSEAESPDAPEEIVAPEGEADAPESVAEVPMPEEGLSDTDLGVFLGTQWNLYGATSDSARRLFDAYKPVTEIQSVEVTEGEARVGDEVSYRHTDPKRRFEGRIVAFNEMARSLPDSGVDESYTTFVKDTDGNVHLVSYAFLDNKRIQAEQTAEEQAAVDNIRSNEFNSALRRTLKRLGIPEDRLSSSKRGLLAGMPDDASGRRIISLLEETANVSAVQMFLAEEAVDFKNLRRGLRPDATQEQREAAIQTIQYFQEVGLPIPQEITSLAETDPADTEQQQLDDVKTDVFLRRLQELLPESAKESSRAIARALDNEEGASGLRYLGLIEAGAEPWQALSFYRNELDGFKSLRQRLSTDSLDGWVRETNADMVAGYIEQGLPVPPDVVNMMSDAIAPQIDDMATPVVDPDFKPKRNWKTKPEEIRQYAERLGIRTAVPLVIDTKKFAEEMDMKVGDVVDSFRPSHELIKLIEKKLRLLDEGRAQEEPDDNTETPGDRDALEEGRGDQSEEGTYEDISKAPGREISVLFEVENAVTGRYAVIEARDLKPSHFRDGSRNPQHRISMGQPRDRSQKDVKAQPELMARKFNPELITGNYTAFQGAPVSTPDGQAIQGSGRMIALTILYGEYKDKAADYKAFLVNNADAYGIPADAIEQMEQPVLVRELNVPAEEAVRLGNIPNQFEAKTNRTDQAKATIRNLPASRKEKIGALLSKAEGETLMEMIDDVGVEILDQFEGLDRAGLIKDGKLTQDGKELIREAFVGLIFDSEVNPDAIKFFRRIPHLIRAGIERSMGNIVSFTGTDADFGPVLQKAVEIIDSIEQSEGAIKNVNQFMREGTVFEGRNMDRFTPAEAAVAEFLLGAKNQREIRNLFRQIERTIHGETTLFEETPGTGVSAQGLQEALAQALGFTPPSGSDPAGTEPGPEGRGRGPAGQGPGDATGTDVEGPGDTPGTGEGQAPRPPSVIDQAIRDLRMTGVAYDADNTRIAIQQDQQEFYYVELTPRVDGSYRGERFELSGTRHETIEAARAEAEAHVRGEGTVVADQPGDKQPWEMTPQEFDVSVYTPLVERIQAAIRQGTNVSVRTAQRVTPLKAPGDIRITPTGQVQTRERRNEWVSLVQDQIYDLAGQAGLEAPAPTERPSHMSEIGEAIERGDPVPPENVRLYEEFRDRHGIGEEPGEYAYHLVYRPFDIGTYPPDNFVRYEDDGSRHGLVIYSQPLSLAQQRQFQLEPVTELQEYDGKQVYYYEDYRANVTIEPSRTGVLAVKMEKLDQDGQPVDTETLSGTEFLSGIAEGEYRPVTEQRRPPRRPKDEEKPKRPEEGPGTGRADRPKQTPRPPTGTAPRDRGKGYQKPAPGDPSEWGRPGLVYTTDAKTIPTPKEHVRDGDFAAIDEHQRFGVNMILDRFEKGGEGFLLADGTGSGKTMQILAAAHRLQESGKGKVLVITQNQQIIDNNFADDARLMGVDLSAIEMGTYTQLADGKVGKGDYYAVLFDEAHNLKNQDTKKSKAARKVNSKHRVFVTATPFDTVEGAVYFITSVTNMTEQQAYGALGLVRKQVTDKQGRVLSETYHLDKGVKPGDIPGRINALRNRIMKDGGMLRRELPYYGQIREISVEQTAEGRQMEEMIDDYWETRVDEERNENGFIPLNKLKNLMGQRSGELSRANEIDKIDEVESRVLADIEAGRSVVVIAEGINPTEIKALGEVIPGFHSEMMKRLDSHGIKYAKVFGQGDKSGEVAKFQRGDVRVALATPQSGGTGVNFDDSVGNQPRALYMVTANYSGNQFDQILGRVSRRNTRTPAETNILYNTGQSDARRKQIVSQKVKTLQAIQQGLQIDEAGFDIDGITEQAPETDVSGYNTALKGTDVVAEAYGATVMFKGDTKPVKHRLKGIKARWHGKQKGWMIPAQNTNQIKQAIDAIRDEKGLPPVYGVAGPIDGTSRSIIGRQGARYLDYMEDVTTRLDNLRMARNMEKSGKATPKAIYLATGWERGADGKWRYEIPDVKIKDQHWDKTSNRLAPTASGARTTLADIVEGELLKAYPDLKQVRVNVEIKTDPAGPEATYSPTGTGHITLYYIQGAVYADGVFYSNLIHEIQHAVQHLEGFSEGGSKRTIHHQIGRAMQSIREQIEDLDRQIRQVASRHPETQAEQKKRDKELSDLLDKKEQVRKNLIVLDQKSLTDRFRLYQSLAGEVEARNVERRAKMTPEQLRDKMMQQTEDVSRRDQVVLMRGLDMNDSGPSLEAGALPREPVRRTRYKAENYDPISPDVLEVQVRIENNEMFAVSNDSEIRDILALLGGVYNEHTGEFRFSQERLSTLDRYDIAEQIQGFLQMREDGFRSVTRTADSGAPKRKASYMNERPATKRGKKFHWQIKRDKKGQKVGMRTIVDYLNEVVMAEMRVGKTQTTRRHPAHYMPLYHMVRTRIGDWVLNFHEAGHALSAILRDADKNWWKNIKKDLKNIAETIGVHASAKTAEEGFAEWVRLYITDPTKLPSGVTRAVEQHLKDKHPNIYHGLQDAGRMYVAHAERSPTARHLSGRYDRGIKKPIRDRLRDNREHFLFYYGSVEQANDMVIHRIFRKMFKEDQALARRWRADLKGSPGDIQSAWHQMYQIYTEVKRVIHGDPRGDGLRIMAQAHRKGTKVHPEHDIVDMHVLSLERDPRLQAEEKKLFEELGVDNIVAAMRAVGFRIPKESVSHGEYIKLSDKSIDGIKKEVGSDNWQNFQVYGHFRTLLYRYENFGHSYQGMRDTLPPSVLRSEIKRLEKEFPKFDPAYKDVQHLFDQLILLPVFSGEKSPLEAIRIVREHEDYWPLNKMLEGVEGRGMSFKKGQTDSGLRPAERGSEHALMDFDMVVERRVNAFLEAYYNNRYQNALINLIEDILYSPEYSIEVKAIAGRIMTPLRLETKKVATLNETEAKEVIADYLNQQQAELIAEEMKREALDPDNPDPVPEEWSGGISADEISLNWSGKPIYRSTSPRAVNVVAPFRNGQRRFYQIQDQILFDAITRSTDVNETLQFVYDVLYPMTEAIKQPISHGLTFGLRQLVGRNIPHQLLLAEHKRQLIPAFNTAIGIINRMTGKEVAAIDLAHLLSMAFNKTSTKEHYTRWQNFLEILGEGVVFDDYFHVSNLEKAKRFPGQMTRLMMKPISMTQYMAGLREASVFMESVPREGAFVVEKSLGYSTEVAQRAAAYETGYFASYPGSPNAHQIYKILLYRNPGIQTNFQEFQKLLSEPDPQKRRQAWLVKIPTIMAYNSALCALVLGAIGYFMDEPEEVYAELRDRTMTDRMHFKYFNKHFKIPFGYGIAGAAEAIGWNLMEDYLLENPMETRERVEMVLRRLRDYPGGLTYFMPPHMQAAIELEANYQFFFGENIVPPFLESHYPYNPELQYYHSTPEIYRRGGDILGVSPLKIQYATRVLMSNHMDQMITTADRLLRGEPVELADLPDVGGLFRREAVDGRSRSVRTIQEMSSAYDGLNQRLSVLERQGISPEDHELLSRQMMEFHTAKAVHDHIRGVRRSIRDLRDQNRMLNNQRPERYRQMIRANNETIEALQRELTDIAREYVPIIRQEQEMIKELSE